VDIETAERGRTNASEFSAKLAGVEGARLDQPWKPLKGQHFNFFFFFFSSLFSLQQQQTTPLSALPSQQPTFSFLLRSRRILFLLFRSDFSPPITPQPTMAPSRDESVDSLKDIIGKLESRVAQLEHRLVHGDDDSKKESMRMVLMGPPGAGTILSSSFLFPCGPS
jgi:hypothetical protein